MTLVLTLTGSSLPGSCMKVSPSVCLSLPFHCTLPARPSAGRPPPECVQVPPAGSLIGSLSKLLAYLFCSSHFRPFFSSVCNGFLSFGWPLLNGFFGGFVSCVVTTPSLSLPLSRRTQAGFQLHPPASTAPSSAGITGVHPRTPLFSFAWG